MERRTVARDGALRNPGLGPIRLRGGHYSCDGIASTSAVLKECEAADQNTQLCDTRPGMRRLLIVPAMALTSVEAAPGQTDQPIAELLRIHQYDLAAEGKALLEKEARAASFFLIGGLHGDKETPALVDSSWPTVGYQYLAAEMSPWAASRLKDSTLGNFIAELAIAEGGLRDLDQRKDDPTFGVLASAARYPATLLDLRPIRRALHQIAPDKLSAIDSGLLYWADSYDAIVCYREVTPADQ
jgi:hypothetical protein